MTLTDVLENNTNPPGNSVAAIIASATGDRITDVDSGAVEGVAVIGVDDSNGTWEYSLNFGGSWNSFVAQGVATGTTDDTAAVLLNEAALIRFVPNLGYTGASGDLTFRAWDQTSGVSGDVGVNTSINGNPTAFSAATETATLTVVPAAGVITLVPGAQNTDEDTSLVFSAANGNAITVDDGSAGDPVLRAELSVTNGILTLNTIAGLSFESGADGTSSMTITGLESAINTALDGLSFTPAGDYNGPANLQITMDLQGNLLSRYTFDNPAELGNDDSPTGSNDGTVINATAAVDGTRGNVLSLDAAGGADYVQINGCFGNPTSVTLAAWVNLTTPDPFGAEVISLGNNVSLRVDELGNMKGFMYNGSTWKPVIYATTLAGMGWHHVAYTFDDAGNVQKLYLDGVEVASVAETASISYTQGANSFIGMHGNSGLHQDYTGMIDDVRIYERALTDSEIANLFDETTTDTKNVSITVDPINDAPVLADDNPTLTAIDEDDFTSAGDSVAAIVVDGSITDPDGSAVESIAITAVDDTNGTWQYSTDNGGSWADVDDGSLAVDHALLLDGTLAGASTQKLRFVPNADYNGSATFTFRAWDQSTGSAGTYADTTATTAFSSATDTAAITINAINDNPSGAGSLTTTSLNDNAGATNLFSGLTVSDADTGENDLSLTITLTDATAGTISGGGFTETGRRRLHGHRPDRGPGRHRARQRAVHPDRQHRPDSGTFNTDISVDGQRPGRRRRAGRAGGHHGDHHPGQRQPDRRGQPDNHQPQRQRRRHQPVWRPDRQRCGCRRERPVADHHADRSNGRHHQRRRLHRDRPGAASTRPPASPWPRPTPRSTTCSSPRPTTPAPAAPSTPTSASTVNDQGGGGEQAVLTATTVTITRVNDNPSGAGSLTTTSLNDNAGATNLFGGLTVSDVDTGENDLSLTITLTNAAAGTISGGGFTETGPARRLPGHRPDRGPGRHRARQRAVHPDRQHRPQRHLQHRHQRHGQRPGRRRRAGRADRDHRDHHPGQRQPERRGQPDHHQPQRQRRRHQPVRRPHRQRRGYRRERPVADHHADRPDRRHHHRRRLHRDGPGTASTRPPA